MWMTSGRPSATSEAPACRGPRLLEVISGERMEDYVLLGRHCVLLALLVVSLYTDLAQGKLYNAVTLPALCLGLVLNYALGGLVEGGVFGHNLASGLLGLVAVGLLFLWPYLKGGIAAGDVKLACAVAAIGGFSRYTFCAIAYSAVLGALMALLVLIRHGRLWAGMKGSVRLAFGGKRADAAPPQPASEGGARLTVPYGAAIAIGSTLAWFVVELPH